MAGLVGGLNVQQEEVPVAERIDTRHALGGVVVVEPGARARNIQHLDSREHPNPRTRSTAEVSRPVTP